MKLFTKEIHVNRFAYASKTKAFAYFKRYKIIKKNKREKKTIKSFFYTSQTKSDVTICLPQFVFHFAFNELKTINKKKKKEEKGNIIKYKNKNSELIII